MKFEVFSTIRSDGSSTADSGTATATIRYGDVTAFEAACQRLAG